MADSPIRLVCFDLGGVLIRICRSWREGVLAARLDLRADWPDGFPESSPEWRELSVLLGTGAIDAATWAARASAAMNGLYSPDEARAIHLAWILGEYEGVCGVIDRIHDAGLTTAALSNTNAEHWAQLVDSPAVRRLHHRLASHELRLHKPDPAIYRAAEQRLGFAGSDILFFDDSPENVEAARSIGWRAHRIDPHARTDQQIVSVLRKYGVLNGDESVETAVSARTRQHS